MDKKVEFWLRDEDAGGANGRHIKEVFNCSRKLCLLNFGQDIRRRALHRRTHKINLEVLDVSMPDEDNELSDCCPSIYDCLRYDIMYNKWHHLHKTLEVLPN